MFILQVIAGILLGILGIVVLGLSCLGAAYFIDCVKEYEKESKYFSNDN